MSQPQIINGIVADEMRMQNEQATNNTTLTMLLNEKTGVDKSIENLVSAIEKGVVTKTTTSRLHELERRQEELERQIRIEQSKAATKVTEKKVHAFYEEALREEPQMLIACLVKEVVLYDDRMEIHYNTPASARSRGRSKHFRRLRQFPKRDRGQDVRGIIRFETA